MNGSAVRNSPLPPSVEKAYHQKCIDLKRRLNEIEEANDAARLRKARIDRAIIKMRIERAILLDHLAKSQQLYAVHSDRSTSPPPTPLDHPRIKRPYHRRSSPPNDYNAVIMSPSAEGSHGVQHPSHQYRPQYLPVHQSYPVHQTYQVVGPPGMQHMLAPHHPHQPPVFDEHSMIIADQRSTLPTFDSVPIGTSIVTRGPDGKPKRPPYTIADLENRHHYNAVFDTLSTAEQEQWIFEHRYLPFNMQGQSVILHQDLSTGRWRQLLPGYPGWIDPGMGPRTDGAQGPAIAKLDRTRRSSEEGRQARERHREVEATATSVRDANRDVDTCGYKRPVSGNSGSQPQSAMAAGGGFTAVNR